jgi:cytochrome c peroxidase
MMKAFTAFALTAALASSLQAKTQVDRSRLGMFQPIAKVSENAANPLNDAKIDLGRMLYYDKRLSLDHTVSCNTCHALDSFGDDGAPVSTGIAGQKGGRSAPTVYNAAIHIAQFWDGRAPDVEAQAVGPITNPIEMGMPSEEYTVEVLRSIPGYLDQFKKAFPEEKQSLTYKNIGRAIGAFERKLLTPSRFDKFLEGDDSALTDTEKQGLNLFIEKGCATCHNGMGVGGHLYQKLGLVKPWPTKDKGRGELKGFEAMTGFFKVPSLRNITETAPYLHDGSVKTLPQMVKKMAEYQQGFILTDQETDLIVSFLGSLKGEVDACYIAEPKLPSSSSATPKPKKYKK